MKLERRSITLYEWVTDYEPRETRAMLALYAMQVEPKD